MTLKEARALFAPDDKIKELEKFVASLSSGKIAEVRLSGLEGSSVAMALSSLKRRKSPFLVIADDMDTAGYLYNDLCQIAGQEAVAAMPSGFKRDIKYGQPDLPSQILRTETIAAWNGSKELRWVVTCPEALAEKVPVKKKVEESSLVLKKGQRVLQTDVVAHLRELGFRETDYVYDPGQFARRGSILDVYSYAADLPFRIDFFDDEIDSIRHFNVETQLSEEKTDVADLFPSVSDGSEEGVSLLEFVGDDTVLFCQSPSWLLSRVEAICGERLSEDVSITEEGDPDAMSKVVNFEAFRSRFMQLGRIVYGHNTTTALLADTPLIDFECSRQSLYHKNFEIISESFSKFLAEGYRILLLSDSPYQAERLKAIFEDRGDRIVFTPVDRTLHEGFVDHMTRVCFFTDHQIFDRFHKYSLRSDRARSGKVALSLKELAQIEPGDYIVHVDHGIGRFGGLIKTSDNGKTQEQIKLIYQNDDIILVSIHALHKLSKYRAKDGVPPKISKLGSSAWNRIKEKTKSKLKDIARDLIKLYASRLEEKGFSFSPDSYLQHELEASFIYEDTPDQIKTVEAVKRDMESPRPMDRLVCGDVGFGKTEIAVRAAFKAAADSKQTAVLVPTTVLAMQHYHTFSNRLKDLPVRVDFLSRARTAKETKQVLADLADGKIDIIIGTHKLIGKSVKFKDLGLLIVDEEQKFGVAVKEKLKQMKVNVDTLTMSATPIPRTLQFSLMGARDLSSLNTPPANRHPIVTTVSPFSDDVIKDAVGFELSRDGQVFFISDRIADLDVIESALKRLVPGVRVVKAHGQMAPDQLEKAIMDFVAREYDVLLSTTIVENGIDMPNVNTILVNHADHFGLSELHQLRGRVGRSSRKAFCYLLVNPNKPLTPVAHRRLQAIESFSDLGSGIHIAMQDLDIRGAGNLLGAEQSGFIADLGYETFQKILKEAVMEIKTEEFGETFTDVNAGVTEEFTTDCVIESDLELRLLPAYVPQEAERISLYQELDNLDTDAQIEGFRQRLRDRFGAIPDVTEELINVVALRREARSLGVERLVLKGGKMRVFFVSPDNRAYYNSAAFGRVLAFFTKNPRRVVPREGDKYSMLIHKVYSVSDALGVLADIKALDPK